MKMDKPLWYKRCCLCLRRYINSTSKSVLILALVLIYFFYQRSHRNTSLDPLPLNLCISDYQNSKIVLDTIIVSPPPNTHVTILCYVMTIEAYHTTRGQAVLNTWGAHCDEVILFSTSTDPKYNAIYLQHVNTDYEHLWSRHIAVLQYLHEKYSQYDYYFKADDDTFVIVENLRYLLSTRNGLPHSLSHTDNGLPFHMGHVLEMPKYRYGEVDVPKEYIALMEEEGRIWYYPSGGAGYVMNNAYVTKFVEVANKKRCLPFSKMPEDAGLAFCMSWENIHVCSGRDSTNRERFHVQTPEDVWNGRPVWMNRYQKHLGELQKGKNSVSENSVSFHYITPKMMTYMYAQLYTCRK